MNLRLFVIILLFFNAQINLPVHNLKVLSFFNNSYSEEVSPSNSIYDKENQSQDLDLSQGSTAGDFAKTLLTTLTMMVIGLVGVYLVSKYSVIANDSKLFAIGAIVYLVGEVVSIIQASIELFDDKEKLKAKSDNLQVETLTSMKEMHEKRSYWLMARAGLQTAALTVFGISSIYSTKLYLKTSDMLNKLLASFMSAIAEQQKNLAICKSQDPAATLVQQPGADPGAIGLPYYSVLCPQTTMSILRVLQDGLNKTKLEIVNQNTIFNPEGSGDTVEQSRVRKIRYLDVAQDFIPGATKALKIESLVNEEEIAAVQKINDKNKSFLEELEKKIEERFFKFLEDMEVNAAPGINYLSQGVKSAASADRALYTNALITELELSAEKNLYVSLAQTTLNVTKLEDKIAVSIATNTASLMRKGLTRAAASRLAQTTVVKGVAKALVRWLAPRVTAVIATSAAAAAVPGIGWLASATNLALGAYTIYGLWDAFSQTSHWRDVKKMLYVELERQGYGDVVDWLQASMFYFPGAPCYHYDTPTPLINPNLRCDQITFDLFPLHLKGKSIYQVNNVDEVIAEYKEVAGWESNLINKIIPSANAGLFTDLGIKAGGIAVMMIFRKKLMLLIDTMIAKPLGRSVMHGSITALTAAVVKATYDELNQELENIQKIDNLIQKMKNEFNPNDGKILDENKNEQTFNVIKKKIKNLIEKIFPEAISEEVSSRFSSKIDKKTPCFYGKINGRCRSFQKQISAIYPIHKDILDKKFYGLVQNAAEIGDGISNANGITPAVGKMIEKLNSNQRYVASLNRSLVEQVNNMQAQFNIKRTDFKQEQKSFLEKVKEVALESIKEAGIKLDDVLELFPGNKKDPTKKATREMEKKQTKNSNKNESSKSNKINISKDYVNIENNQSSDNYEYENIGIINKKDASLFKIISKRYMIKFSNEF